MINFGIDFEAYIAAMTGTVMYSFHVETLYGL